MQAGCDAVDRGILLSHTLHEISTGLNTASLSRRLRESGGYAVPMILFIDAMSVFAAVTASFIKNQAEEGQLCHLHFLLEQLDHAILEAIAWSDTRDMLADGLTKGSVERDAIHNVMLGLIKVCHDMKIWKSSAEAR